MKWNAGWSNAFVQARITSPTNPYRLEYEALLLRAEALLQDHRLVGYHCSRLTSAEIERIWREGLRALSQHLVRERLEALADAGEMHPGRRTFFLNSPALHVHLANAREARAGMVTQG